MNGYERVKKMKELMQKVFEEKMKDGTLESAISEQFDSLIKELIKDQFRYGGECKKAMEEKVREAILPCIKEYDFTEFLPKLDVLLTQIANNCRTHEYKNLVQNFERLNKPMFERKQVVTLGDLMKIYAKYASKEVDTSDLEVDYDDVRYKPLTCNTYFEEQDKTEWSCYNRGTILFFCEEDDALDFGFEVSKYERDDKWSVERRSLSADIKSVASITEIELMVENLCYADCLIDLSITEYTDDYVEVEAEPEASWS